MMEIRNKTVQKSSICCTVKADKINKNSNEEIIIGFTKNSVLANKFHHKTKMCHHRRKSWLKLVHQGHFSVKQVPNREHSVRFFQAMDINSILH